VYLRNSSAKRIVRAF